VLGSVSPLRSFLTSRFNTDSRNHSCLTPLPHLILLMISQSRIERRLSLRDASLPVRSLPLLRKERIRSDETSSSVFSKHLILPLSFPWVLHTVEDRPEDPRNTSGFPLRGVFLRITIGRLRPYRSHCPLPNYLTAYAGKRICLLVRRSERFYHLPITYGYPWK